MSLPRPNRVSSMNRPLHQLPHQSPARAGLRRARRAVAPAFSLIEVLIAVLILALGLLGLGAVFPVIIREQKIGNDIIIGTLAGNSARASFQGMIQEPNFWVDARAVLTGNAPDTGIPYEQGAWLPAEIEPAGLETGEVHFPEVGGNSMLLPLKFRLYPFDAPAAQPQFVWDLALQRIADGDTSIDNDALRVAFFVRRADPRIRVPKGTSLYRAFAGRTGLPQADWRVPVAEDTDGVPSYDGLGDTQPRYSQIRTMEIEFRYNPTGTAEQRRRDRLYVRPGDRTSVEWRLAKQPNQKLIDNLGNVYTVLESGTLNANEEYIRISPEVPAYVTRNDQIREIAFTPQVAAAIVTWKVTP